MIKFNAKLTVRSDFSSDYLSPQIDKVICIHISFVSWAVGFSPGIQIPVRLGSSATFISRCGSLRHLPHVPNIENLGEQRVCYFLIGNAILCGPQSQS